MTLVPQSNTITPPPQVVFDFVDGLETESVPLEYALATTFPRKVLGQKELSQSLKELGLSPAVTLLLQPL